MAKRVSITGDYIDQTKSLINCFGGVRYDSFLRYLQLSLDISAETSEKIADKLLRQQELVKARYSNTSIVKTDKSRTANYDYLDAFEVYLGILKEEKQENPEAEVSVMHTSLPTDFVIYTTSGYVYDVVINNDRGAQKVKILEKADKKRYAKQITLFVFTSGADLSAAKAPVLPGKYRLAVVRRTDTGIATCALGKVEGANE